MTSYRQVLLWANRRQLGALAITDHNTIAAALALRELSPIPIIVGEEIRTTRGEIIGLFLQEEIPPDLSPAETVRRIREQGGLVYVPHPCDRVRSSALEPEALREIIAQVDVLEVLNARVTLPSDNRQAEDLARAHHLRMGAGSDAHQAYEIGRAYVEMPPFEDAAGFMQSLSQGQVMGGLSSPLVHFGSTWAKLAKKFRSFTSFPK